MLGKAFACRSNENNEEIQGITQGICNLYKYPRIVKTLEAITGWACSLDGDKFIYIFGRKM
jgi:hypothetical protein